MYSIERSHVLHEKERENNKYIPCVTIFTEFPLKNYTMELKNFFKGVNLNYRSRAVAKGLLRTMSCGMLFRNVFYRKMMNCFKEDIYFEKIVIARARLVPVPNRASDFRIPKTLRKEGMLAIF